MALQEMLKEAVVKMVDGKPVDVEVSSFEGEGKVLGLYFSAHWCPPCRSFTPTLAEWYRKIKAGPNGSNFDIVFLSSDRDEASFKEYYDEMPWHAVPYADRDTKTNLSRKFKVSGIPTLVLLDAGTGKVITQDGRSIVNEDLEGKNFPWTPKPLQELIGDKFVTKDGKDVSAEAIEGKVLGLYFSAHWCGPCRAFTPQLVEAYNTLQKNGKDFEIIFCSSDRDEGSFKEYFETMPWIALPFNDSRKKALSRHFDISGIPSLIIIDKNFKTITMQGRSAVGGDPKGEDFPWHPRPLNKLSGATAGQINDTASLIVFTDGSEDAMKETVEMMEPIAKDCVTRWETEGKDPELCFFYAGNGDGSDDDIVTSLRTFASLPTKTPLLAIIDIPDQTVFTSETQPSQDVIKKFVDEYLAKTLKGRPLRSS